MHLNELLPLYIRMSRMEASNVLRLGIGWPGCYNISCVIDWLRFSLPNSDSFTVFAVMLDFGLSKNFPFRDININILYKSLYSCF